MFRNLLARLFGSGGSTDAASAHEAVEYGGYRIRPTPYLSEGQYQTAGVIERDPGGEANEHRFVRAEKHASREDAASFAITKGKQIIDQDGARLFEKRAGQPSPTAK
jgi:hypothetical protein